MTNQLLPSELMLLVDGYMFEWPGNTTSVHGIPATSLIPRPLPDFISQLWRKISRKPCTITLSLIRNGGLGFIMMAVCPAIYDQLKVKFCLDTL